MTLVYLHGISMLPFEKIPEMIEIADELNCQIVIFNYRGYAYSQKVVSITEEGIELDA